MLRIVAKGKQNFSELRKNNCFYVDKTRFIKDWWNSQDDVTLITRPRRFGKTLMLDTVKTFFSPEFAGRSDLFDGLEIWKDEEFYKLHGTIPVIFVTFADIKECNYNDSISSIKEIIIRIYRYFARLLDKTKFSDWEKELFSSINDTTSDQKLKRSLCNLSECLTYRYGNKPIILLDEYDAPLQEAWVKGYWDELVDFMRGFLNSTFKTNPYLERGLLTGVTRISKESIFSDLNNLEVVTTTSDLYTDCFGFTEQEVFAAMDEYGLVNKAEVKWWYDGFIFGDQREIYNPWSIICYIRKKIFAPYWAQVTSNDIVNILIAQSNSKVKDDFARLLVGKSITVKLDEQIIFSELFKKKGAIWSFLMASGYVKPLSFDPSDESYTIAITNHEIQMIMENLFYGWFYNDAVDGNKFCNALLNDDIALMNESMSYITENIFSFFDTSGNEPERFYHAFVLGLIVDLKERYEITSNRESGDGRYDIMMIPRNVRDHAIVIEFKTINTRNEKNIEKTCKNALKQIHEKQYINELLNRNEDICNIYVYGFAFKGKHVLICGGSNDKIDWKSILNEV